MSEPITCKFKACHVTRKGAFIIRRTGEHDGKKLTNPQLTLHETDTAFASYTSTHHYGGRNREVKEEAKRASSSPKQFRRKPSVILPSTTQQAAERHTFVALRRRSSLDWSSFFIFMINSISSDISCLRIFLS